MCRMQNNNWVLRYQNAAAYVSGTGAVGVLGQGNFYSDTAYTTQSGMFYPYGVAVDGSGSLYVVDCQNCRVLKFANADSIANGANADAVFGQTDFISANDSCNQSGMSYPTGVAVDVFGNLFVADAANHRVLIFKMLLQREMALMPM